MHRIDRTPRFEPGPVETSIRVDAADRSSVVPFEPGTSSPADTPADHGDAEPSARLLPHLTRMSTFLAIALILRFTLPSTLEEIQYGWTRGRQRAQFETAGEALKSLELSELSSAYQLVSQRVGPSVIHIEIERPRTALDLHPSNRGSRRAPMQAVPSDDDSIHEQLREQGSGVVMDREGLIVTNYHVVASAERTTVTLSDGRRVPAKILGHDWLTDLAVLKVDADHLIAAEWGDSDALEEGALVWAVGTPYGLKRSITAGIVSAKGLAGVAGSVYQDYLQTDAAVNPGSSGGPLVDVHGKIVGINTAILGSSYRGISFAVPSNIVRDVYRRIVDKGRVDRGWLGVRLAEATGGRGYGVGPSPPSGALVDTVEIPEQESPTPAAVAGIQNGDVIVRWAQMSVDGNESLMQHVAQSEIGSCVEIELLRDGKPVTLNVTVGERPLDLD